MKRIFLVIAAMMVAPVGLAGESGKAKDDAAPGYYAIGYTFGQLKGFGYTFDIGALNGAVGWQANRYLALEATGLAGIVNAKLNGATIKLDSGFVASVLPMLPLNESVSAFARVGYSHATLSAWGPGGSGSGSDNGTTFGGGIQYAPPGRGDFGARLEFAQYYSKDGVTITGTSLSFIQRF